MKGFPKVLKTKEDYYNCLAMVSKRRTGGSRFAGENRERREPALY